jgi:hypothetical protein
VPSQISETEALALQIVRALCLLSEGRAHVAFRRTRSLADADTAMQLAADKGWLLIDGDGGVWLTDKGRRLIEPHESSAPPQFIYSERPQQESDHYFSECPRCGHLVDELDHEEVMQHLDPDHEAPAKN